MILGVYDMTSLGLGCYGKGLAPWRVISMSILSFHSLPCSPQFSLHDSRHAIMKSSVNSGLLSFVHRTPLMDATDLYTCRRSRMLHTQLHLLNMMFFDGTRMG